ncbi:MAG TPA: phage holin family protein [Propionibacteriaceae bacterium]|nr:phage holin family protein [Propionibacteriaceae bacterium]
MTGSYETSGPIPGQMPPGAVATDGLPQDGTRLPRDDRSIGQIMGDLSQDLSTLVRQEMALARAEMEQTIKRSSKGAGMFGGAGIAGYMVLLFLSLALWWLLARAFGSTAHPALALSGLVVAVIWAIIAAILAAVGKSEMKKAPGVHETKETVTQIPNALKGDEEKNR